MTRSYSTYTSEDWFRIFNANKSIQLDGRIDDKITVRVAEALKRNPTIKFLNLAHNNIDPPGGMALAEAFKVNKNLTCVNLRGNWLGESEIAICQALKFNPTCDIDGISLGAYHQILAIPPEFSNKPNHEILAYLKELKRSTQPTAIYRIRIMFVGPGEAGKTTLSHKILTGEFSFGQFTMTDGIAMQEWKPVSAQDSIHLSIWDFGGQEVYLNSHPILFSDHALYFLVWNPRVPITTNTLEQYVLNIRSRSKTAPIRLVTTHSSEVVEKDSRLRYLTEKCALPVPLPLPPAVHTASEANLAKHYAVDSSTGDGIEELKSSLIDLVTKEYADYSRVEVPDWYVEVESRIRYECLNGRFSIGQAEFLSICSSYWSPSSTSSFSIPPLISDGLESKDGSEPSSCDDSATSLQRMKSVLDLFHHWGVVFVLPDEDHGPNGGDIVLSPQQLSDVFKFVITCNRDTTKATITKQLFEGGILNHNILGFIWSAYESQLHPQFLCLLHKCELAYEVFDEKGDPTGRSLVPSLLGEPVSPLSEMRERDLRERYLNVWETNSDPELKVKNHMISRGFVKILFNSQLPNFFPRLMVHLHHLSSDSDCSRRHCVVHVSEDTSGTGTAWSLACVVEDQNSNCLFVYPGGCSFRATAIVHQTIRSLISKSFAGMKIEEVTYSANGETLSHEKLLALLFGSSLLSSPHLPVTLNFLSFLFDEFDPKVLSANHASFLDLNLTEAQQHTLSTLQDHQLKYEASNEFVDRLLLISSLLQSIPIFRQHGLKLVPHPNILWIVGRSAPCHLLFGVSPSVNPSCSWEIAWESEISIPHSECDSFFRSSASSPISDVMMRSLKLLLPNQQLPAWHDPVDWIGLADCKFIRSLIFEKEREFFTSEVGTSYSKSLFRQQRGQVRAEDIQKAVTEAMGTVVQELSNVSQGLNELRIDLRGLRDDIKADFKSIKMELLSVNSESIEELGELWSFRMQRLESLFLSDSCDHSQMVREMKGLAMALESKLFDLDERLDPAGVLNSLMKLREEFVSALARGDVGSKEMMNDLLEELKRVVREELGTY